MAKAKDKSKARATAYDRAFAAALLESKPTQTQKIFNLLVEADKAGDRRATYAIATWYLFGSPFTPKNHKTGVKLLKIAAAANVAEAAYDLGVAYETGVGIRKSEKLAFTSYMHAALLGDPEAHRAVGRMYFYGIGTAQNRKLAGYWLDKAEELGVTK